MQKNISTSFRAVHIYKIVLAFSKSKNKNMSSDVDFWNVSENFGAEILNNLNMLTEHLALTFIATNFKALLAEKIREGHLFNKIVTCTML
jgi:hypothetical protein